WSVVGAAFVGMLLSIGVLVAYSFGVITSAMGAEFGWSPVQRAALFVSFSLCVTFAGPIWGAIADRVGARRSSMTSAVLLAACFFGLAAIPNNLLLAHLAFAAIGVLGSGTLPPTYASVVVGWFDRRRGLALGVAMIGVGVGAALLPPIAAKIVVDHGWRNLCVTYGSMLVVLSLPIAAMFLRPHPEQRTRLDGAAFSIRASIGAAFRQQRTWILALFAFTTGAILLAGVTSFVPLLQSRGETLVQAARYQSFLGIALIVGRLICGGLLDRVFAPRVITGVFLVTAIGFFLLREANTPIAYFMAAIGIGLAIGSEIDFLAFIVSRYYDRAAFTTLFALLFAIYSLGAAAGPPAFAWLLQTSGGYGLGLVVCAGLALLVAVLMFALPRYDAARH
ncbi:MAG TPA: MFS transporter, partial [Burkholderiaceae bacterium]|nr:MFS transporter [Burkholderiaceae bacterium]